MINEMRWATHTIVTHRTQEGQASEYKQSPALIEGYSAGYVLADKGYDSNEFVSAVEKVQVKPVILLKKNRLEQRYYDKELYKEHNLVERLFQKIQHFRRVATRYERLKRNDQAMVDM